MYEELNDTFIGLMLSNPLEAVITSEETLCDSLTVDMEDLIVMEVSSNMIARYTFGMLKNIGRVIKDIFMSLVKFVQSIMVFISSSVFKRDERYYDDNVASINKYYSLSNSIKINAPVYQVDRPSVEIQKDIQVLTTHVDPIVDLMTKYAEYILEHDNSHSRRLGIAGIGIGSEKRPFNQKWWNSFNLTDGEKIDAALDKLFQFVALNITKISYPTPSAKNFHQLIYRKYFGNIDGGYDMKLQEIKDVFKAPEDLQSIIHRDTVASISKLKDHLDKRIKYLNNQISPTLNSNTDPTSVAEELNLVIHQYYTGLVCFSKFPTIIWKLFYGARKIALQAIGEIKQNYVV